MLDGLPLGVVHAAALLNKQFSHKTDRLKELSETLEENRAQLSIEPRSVEEWLRNYHLSDIHSRLDTKLKIIAVSMIFAEAAIMESSLTYWERKLYEMPEMTY